MQLNSNDIAAFRDSGYLTCRGLFSGAALADLIRWTDELEAKIADEQAKAMEQAEAGINQISDVVQSNSANAEETSATSEELSAQAETMNELISKFILEKK